LTDGSLILRYMFEIRGSVHIAVAVGPLATHKKAPEIEARIQIPS
jgi:hypothetical protein